MAKRSIPKGVIKDVLIVVVGFLIVWLSLQLVFGTQNPFYVVASGSMIPVLEVYDVLIVSGHEPFEDIQIGDIIVFNRPSDHDRVIVHRVVSITNEDPKTVKTKGDANPGSIPGTDFPITEEEYIGKVIYTLPQVGYATNILKPPVNYILIALIIGIMVIKQVIKKKNDKGEEEDDPLSDEFVPKDKETKKFSKFINISKDTEYSKHAEDAEELEDTEEPKDLAKTDEINKKLEDIDDSIEDDKESTKKD